MDFSWFETPYKIVVILILALFLCLSAWSYLHHRLQGKISFRAKFIQHRLGTTADNDLLSTDWVGGPRGRDYIVPVASAVVVTIFGTASCLFANQLLSTDLVLKLPSEASLGEWRSILLTGLSEETDAKVLQQIRWQSLAVMSLAFLGAFIWSAHNIIRRYINYDLIPVEYYHTTLRLILAPLLALMLAYLVGGGAIGSEGLGNRLLPVAAFMTGMIPSAVLFSLQDWFVRLLKSGGLFGHHLPLSMIEGLNRFHEVRLSEAGIDNAQNLASADLNELALSTPYPLEQLLDWIDQARLYVHLRDDLAALRKHRVRTASDLVNVDLSVIERLHNEEGLGDLATVARLIRKDPKQVSVNRWRHALALGDDDPTAAAFALIAEEVDRNPARRPDPGVRRARADV